MSETTATNATAQRELVITRDVEVPAEKLFQGWTDPELLKQWFCPQPWGVSRAELDLRPGGSCLVVMRSPEGQEFPNPGVYLEVVPNRRLVFTDAFTKAWEPSAQPFMTGIVEFEDLGGGRTRYTARARHWTVADREKHEAMGFHAGWNKALDQLLELVGKH
jgi:uncharacterized protein YndB with AHSA1/START domain